MQRWSYALVVIVALVAPVLVLLVVLTFEGLAFASHHHNSGPNFSNADQSAYNKGQYDGYHAGLSGTPFVGPDQCVQENNGVFGINTEAYCSGFVEGEHQGDRK